MIDRDADMRKQGWWKLMHPKPVQKAKTPRNSMAPFDDAIEWVNRKFPSAA